jgi:energy-coupling factor transporter ATP-binding protein EcfA2
MMRWFIQQDMASIHNFLQLLEHLPIAKHTLYILHRLKLIADVIDGVVMVVELRLLDLYFMSILFP